MALRRFEIVSHLRERVESLGAERSLELEEKTRRGLRVYEFGESAEVLNNAVAATVLFLDLRGFTRTSEGHISERRPDPRAVRGLRRLRARSSSASAAPSTSTSGDGMMVTWGTDAGRPARPAERAAHGDPVPGVAARGSARRGAPTSRWASRSTTAASTSRASSPAAGELHSTVIGRNVNLAGRLSSAAKRPIEEDEGARRARRGAAASAGRG